jgi:type VI secretion system protein ImpK
LGEVIAALPPAGPVSIVQQVAAAPVAVPRPAALGPQLRACLPEAARNQQDAVTEGVQALRIRLPNAGLFASGSAELQATIRPAMLCLAQLLKAVDGKVLVAGHTDNIPIHTTRFPSNWELSKARAGAVAAVFQPVLNGPLQVIGRGDSEPIASNATEDGRSQNRRVDILLVK